MSIAAKSLGSPRNGMPGRAGYVWRGNPALSEEARKRAAQPIQGAAVSKKARRLRARDVPASCICGWHWRPYAARWERDTPAAGCPWHTRRAA